MSHRLTARSIDHVVLERGEVANSWRTERWDSLRLLTPNWHARLPGHRYAGDRPRRVHDGAGGHGPRRRLRPHDRRPAAERHDGHAGGLASPTATRSRPTAVSGGARRSCIATGACNVAVVPPIAAGLPDGVASAHPADVSQPRRPGTPAACWSSGPRRPGSSSPRRSSAAVATSRWPSASTSGCRGRTAAATSSGGPTRRASSTSGTTSSTTSSAPATSRRPN